MDESEEDQSPHRFTDTGGSTTPERHSIQKTAKVHRFKKFFIVVGVLLLVGVAAYGAFKILRKKPATTPTEQTAAPVVETPKELPKDVPDAGAQKPYDSTKLGLSLSYPDTWKLAETADAGIRLESPGFTYVSDKGSTDGYFKVYIRKGARASDSTYIGQGMAIEPSTKLVYTQPAANQRKDTLLSLFGANTTDRFSYFFIAGNFQLKKGDTLGPDYGKEADTYIIAGGFADATLKEDMATNAVDPALLATSNAYKQAVAIVASLQLN